jgi:integrase
MQIYSHLHLISSILNTAVQWQVIVTNPAERVRSPKAEIKESGYLDVTHAQHLIEVLENESIQYKTAIILLLYSGMRRGELCGLEWSDFDFDNCIVSISRSLQRLPGIGIIEKETKTKGSTRVLRLPRVTFTLLREYRKWQNEQRLSLGDQ